MEPIDPALRTDTVPGLFPDGIPYKAWPAVIDALEVEVFADGLFDYLWDLTYAGVPTGLTLDQIDEARRWYHEALRSTASHASEVRWWWLLCNCLALASGEVAREHPCAP